MWKELHAFIFIFIIKFILCLFATVKINCDSKINSNISHLVLTFKIWQNINTGECRPNLPHPRKHSITERHTGKGPLPYIDAVAEA